MWWSRKRALASDQQVVDLLRELQLRLGKAEGELASLTDRFLSLRGFVYSKLRKGEDGEKSDAPGVDSSGSAPKTPSVTNGDLFSGPMTKDEMRARLVHSGRFIPGRPPVHDK